MKKYYCVKTDVYSRGRAKATVAGTVEAENKPVNLHVGLPAHDIYNDWFCSVAEAEAFAKELNGAQAPRNDAPPA